MTTGAEAKTGEIVKQDPAVARMEQMIAQHKGQMAALLGKHISVERLFQIAMTAVSRVPKLKDCTTASVLGCVMESARLRLPAGAGAGGTWLIPRKNGHTQQMECTLIVDYRAIILMMKRDAGVETVVAEAVREKDIFAYGVKANGPFLEWTPAKGDRGAVLGYVSASWNKAGVLTGVIYKTVDEINRTSKAKSMAANDGPWKNDPDWMYKKSVIRPLAKLNPGIESDDLSRAVALDERAELELPQNLHLLADPTAKAHPDETTKKYTPPPTPSGHQPTPAEKLAWAKDAAKKQGVPHEQFDAWVAQQPGGDFEKAEAATEAWKAVAAKTAKAVDVFKVKEETPASKDIPFKFKVYSAASTEYFGEDAYVIRAEPDQQKHFTQDEAIFKAAKAAQKAGTDLAGTCRDLEKDGVKYRWIAAIA